MVDVNRFIVDLRFQRDKYGEMIVLTERQQKLFDSQNLDLLMSLVEQKRALMVEIEAVEPRIAPVRAQWATLREGLDASVRREVETLVGEIAGILENLVRLEALCQQSLQDGRGQTVDQLKHLWQAKQAKKTYGAPKESDSRFLDHQE